MILCIRDSRLGDDAKVLYGIANYRVLAPDSRYVINAVCVETPDVLYLVVGTLFIVISFAFITLDALQSYMFLFFIEAI